MAPSPWLRDLVGELRRLDLRFDRETEAEYEQFLEPEVLNHGVLLAAMGLLIIPISLVPVYIEEARVARHPFTMSGWAAPRIDPRTVMLLCWIVTFSVTALFVVAGVLRMWRGWLAHWSWETFFILVMTCYSVSLSMANFWHLPLLCGVRPEDTWKHDARGAEVYILLALDGIMTVTAMHIPIRCCKLWILPVFGVGSYIVMITGVDSVFPEDRFKSVTAMLALTAFACQGAYRSERHRRQEWLALRQVFEATEVVRQQETTIKETTALVSGLRTVANALCDTIVQLDKDLRVVGTEAGQDSFFETKLEGRPFTDVLAESDRPRFSALVSSVKGAQVHACMPVTLRKSFSTSEAHLLLVDTCLAMPRYFVGVRVEMEHLDGPGQEDVEDRALRDPAPPGLHLRFNAVTPEPPRAPNLNMPEEKAESDFSFTTYPKQIQGTCLAYTPVRARALSLKKVMPRWNIPRDVNSCCQFHTVVESIHEVADFFTDKPCEPLWSTLNGGQCTRCKSMCTQQRTKCVVCGYAEKS